MRASDPSLYGPPIIVASEAHADLIVAQLAEIGVADATVVLEPCARNTAPAIALAALASADPDGLLLVMPSDHAILDLDAFQQAATVAKGLAEDDWLVTFGIAPTGPETGYGYIAAGPLLRDGAHAVASFVEKPAREDAEAMLAKGGHFWNGGIFLFRAGGFLDEMQLHAPEMLEATMLAVEGASRDGQLLRPDAAAFAASPSDSIDYAVMEKAVRVATVPVEMGWSDVGCWDALKDIGLADVSGNVLTGNVRQIEAQGNLIRSDGIRISAIGVADLIIVAAGNEVLIVPRGQSQKVKSLA
jgi:mannose-1-phosphate guanylyltransferase/mannose-1-phosphate guanylyltransferase/mannose-6-phosphate isomerase